MRFPRHVKPFTGTLNLNPFAGLFFLMVLLLALQTSIAPVPGIRIELPAAAPAPASDDPAPTLVVAIDRNELVYFRHQVVPEADLLEALRSQMRAGEPVPALLIQADESVRHGAVLRVENVARAAGIRTVLLATRPSLFRRAKAVEPTP